LRQTLHLIQNVMQAAAVILQPRVPHTHTQYPDVGGLLCNTQQQHVLDSTHATKCA